MGFKTPLRPDFSYDPTIVHNDNGWVVYEIAYEIRIIDDAEGHVATIKVAMAAMYDQVGEPADQDTLDRYYRAVTLPFLHNQLREVLHDLTMRMGIPPLLIDLFRARTEPLPESAASR